MYCRGNPIKYSDPGGYDVYITYPQQLKGNVTYTGDDGSSNSYHIKWDEFGKVIGEATGQPVHMGTGAWYDSSGKQLRGKHGTDMYIEIIFQQSGLSGIGTANSNNYVIGLFESWESDFNVLAERADFKRWSTDNGRSNLATNKLIHEFWHALFGTGGHVAEECNPMHEHATIDFAQRILHFNDAQRRRINSRANGWW